MGLGGSARCFGGYACSALMRQLELPAPCHALHFRPRPNPLPIAPEFDTHCGAVRSTRNRMIDHLDGDDKVLGIKDIVRDDRILGIVPVALKRGHILAFPTNSNRILRSRRSAPHSVGSTECGARAAEFRINGGIFVNLQIRWAIGPAHHHSMTAAYPFGYRVPATPSTYAPVHSAQITANRRQASPTTRHARRL